MNIKGHTDDTCSLIRGNIFEHAKSSDLIMGADFKWNYIKRLQRQQF